MKHAEHTDKHMNNVRGKPQKLVHEQAKQPIISTEHHGSSGYQAPTADRKRQKSQCWVTDVTNPAGDQASRGQEKPGGSPRH